MIYYHTQWITLTSTKSALLYGQDLRVQIIELEKSQTCGFHAHYRVSLSSLNVHLDNNPYTQWSRCSLVKILGISCVALLDSGFQNVKPTLVSDEQPEWNMNLHHWRCFSGAKSCMALCKPMGCSTPGFLVLCYLLEFSQAHVHWGSDAIQPSYPMSSLLLRPSIFPSVRGFSKESVLHIRWPKYWSFNFSVSPSNEHSELISFRIDRLDLFAVQGTLKSLLVHRVIVTIFLNSIYMH